MFQTPSRVVDSKIRLAVVGFDRIASKHFEAVEVYRDHVELVAVCDDQPHRLEQAVVHTGTVDFSNLAELLGIVPWHRRNCGAR